MEPLLSMNFRDIWNNTGAFVASLRAWVVRNTRRGVVYHTIQQDGENHFDHTYLLDVGKEIGIQQVIENKARASDIELVEPPHPVTRYFELEIREYREAGGLSLVDDLQIYPVLVDKKPDIRFRNYVIKRRAATITKRLYAKEGSLETQWIYSHDFHLFAIIHSEDTLDQMVDRIIAKLGEIVTSIHKGSRVSSHLEVTQMLRDAYDTVMEEPPTVTPDLEATGVSTEASVQQDEIMQRPEDWYGPEREEITGHPEVAYGSASEETLKPPVIIPDRSPIKGVGRPEVQYSTGSKVLLQGPVIQPGGEPMKSDERPGVQVSSEPKETENIPEVQLHRRPKVIARDQDIRFGVEQKELPRRPKVQFDAEPKEPSKRPKIQISVEPKENKQDYEGQIYIEPDKISKPSPARTSSELKETIRPPEARDSVKPRDEIRHPPVQPEVKSREIQSRPKVHPGGEPKESPKRDGVKRSIEPQGSDRRMLQREIVQDLDLFGITPDTFDGSKKAIEKINIPEKADVKKKLADVEKEVKDLNWLGE